MFTRRRSLCLLGVVVALALVVMAQTAAAKTVVRIAHPYGESHKVHLAMQVVAKGFEAKYPEYDVQIDLGYPSDKAKLAVIAGDAPDVYYQWLCVPWGADGLFQSLNSYIAKYNVQAKDFVPASWNQNVWRNNVYALPLHIDTNFALLWNKAKFGEVGLEPNQPPKTISDFDSTFKKLTRYNSQGNPVQLGMTPWYVYGNPNTAFTWGWIFGGEFVDYQTGKASAHHPNIVKSFEYLTDYYQQYLTTYNSTGQGVTNTLGSITVARFANERDAMTFVIPSGYLTMLEQFPKLDIGVSRMFSNPDSEVDNPTWIGGFSLGIPVGAKQAEAGFKLIQYMTVDPEGVGLYAATASHMPANIKAPAFRKLGADPKWRVFTETAVSTVRYRPAIPILEEYQAKLGTVLTQVMQKKATAQAALADLSRQIDANMAQKFGK